MKIIYQPTLEEVAEMAARERMRSKTWAQERWVGSLLACVFWTTCCYFFFQWVEQSGPSRVFKPGQFTFGATALIAVITFFVTFWLNNLKFVRKKFLRRIRKNQEFVAQATALAEIEVDGETMTWRAAETSTVHQLSTIKELAVESDWVEISFAPKSLCSLPRRAFASNAERDEFIAALRRGRAGRRDGRSVVAPGGSPLSPEDSAGTVLSYQCTREDIAEVWTRLALRVKAQRFEAAVGASVLGSIGSLIVVYLMNRVWPGSGPIQDAAVQHPIIAAAIVCAIASVVATFSVFRVFSEAALRRRFMRRVDDQYENQSSWTTTYRVEGETLVVSSFGVATSFRLRDLEKVTIDREFVEFSFMPKGLSLVPRRAFASEAAMQQWIALLQGARQDPSAAPTMKAAA